MTKWTGERCSSIIRGGGEQAGEAGEVFARRLCCSVKAVNTSAVTSRQLWGDMLPLFGQHGACMLFRTSSLCESGGSQMEEDATNKSWS